LNWFTEVGQAFAVSSSDGIMRRYFVVNGFDGALTMLGIVSGFYVGNADDLGIVLGACVGAAIALFMSGLSSAYISEAAERQKELAEMEQAMAKDLTDTAHGRAARWVPWMVGAVNGFSPFCIAMLILSPIGLAITGVSLPASPLLMSLLLGLFSMFLLGVFLGKFAEINWLVSGLKSLVVGLVTTGIVLLVG